MQVRIKRLGAALIDHIIILQYVICPKIIISLMIQSQLLDIVSSVLFYFFFITKDLLFKNQSIGKRIFNLYVVDKNNNKPNSIILILRNILILLWELDVFLILLFGYKLCDFIFKTKVIEYKNNNMSQ